MQLHALRYRGARAAAEALAERLQQCLRPEPLSVSFFEAEGGARWEVEAHFEAPPDPRALASALDGSGIAAEALALAPLEERDWVRLSLAGLKPVRAGRVFVHGAHDRAHVPAGAVAVEIDAGQAFGTGHHETTAACLIALGDIVRARRPRAVLDVGTGSGVLAIAAAKLARIGVVATDNDPVAVAVARDNARLNGVGPLVRGLVAQGVRHAEVRRAAPFDLVLANILARPLRGLAGDIAAVLAPGGDLVLSGILDAQAGAVLAAYGARGLRLRRRIRLGEWTTLHLGG